MNLSIIFFLSLLIYSCKPASNFRSTEESRDVEFNIVNGASCLDTDPICQSVGALFGQKPGTNSTNGCTAVLVSPNYVLTAAHCIVSGYHYIMKFGQQMNQDIRSVVEIIIHPERQDLGRFPTNLNDLAILRLQNPVSRPIATLAQTDGHQDVSKVRIVGYGSHSGADEGVKPARTIIQRQKGLPTDEFTKDPWNDSLISTRGNGDGASYGDSGGPNFIDSNNKAMRSIVIGINSSLIHYDIEGNRINYTAAVDLRGRSHTGKPFRSWILGIINRGQPKPNNSMISVLPALFHGFDK